MNIFKANQKLNNANTKHRRLGTQHLEKREMFAGIELAPQGTLTIDADPQGSTVEVSGAIAGKFIVTATNRNGDFQRNVFDRSKVEMIVFNGSEAADHYTNNTNIRERVYGNGGSDVLVGGQGPSFLKGGRGDDILRSRGGNDTIHGDAGNDLIYGGDGDDVLRGGSGNDQIYGNGGDDSLFGNDGDDALFGQAGNDILVGGAGNDELWGDSPLLPGARDLLIGGKGSDTLRGGPKEDILVNGSTTYDNSLSGLSSILRKWSDGIDRYNDQHFLELLHGARYFTPPNYYPAAFLNENTVLEDRVRDKVFAGIEDWSAWSKDDLDKPSPIVLL